jgi:TRAP-type C4-dicarboxylate transport system permease small subunit
VIRKTLVNLDLILSILSLAIITLSVLWGILTRYIVYQPAVWTTELASIAFAWLSFFGAAYAFRLRAHISIDALVTRLSPPWRRLADMLKAIVELGFLVALLGLAVWLSLQSGTRPSPVLRISYDYVYGAISFAILLMIINYVWSLRHRPPTIAPGIGLGL